MKNFHVEFFLIAPTGSDRPKKLRGRVLARVMAKRALAKHPLTVTKYTYWRDQKNRWAAWILRGGGVVEELEAPCEIVPSVAELGWTP